METMRKRLFIKVFALTFLTAGCLISCNQNSENGPTVNEMQTRLDDIMKEYQEMQASCDGFDQQLAAKDSTIQAQAAEIQDLINQLGSSQTSTNGKAQATNTKANRASKSARLSKSDKKLAAQLEAKKAEIAQLQRRLEQQTAELDALKAADNYADREALARLQRTVREQDVRIVALTNDKVVLTAVNDSLTAHIAYILGVRNREEAANQTDYAAQVVTLQGQVANQQAEIARLQSELANQTALLAEANETAKNAKAQAEKAAADSKANTAKVKGNITKKLAQLQAQCDEYFEELERLRAENVILKNENDSLRSEVVAIRRNAENVAVENAKMAAKVSRASVLGTSSITVTPLKRLSNGTGRPTSRATAANAFRIEGFLLDNNVIEPGTITIYAMIITPSSAVLHNGTMEQKFDANGERSTYTMVQAFEFTGSARQFDMSWSKDDETLLEAGIYKVKLYANGSLIGQTEFKLK